MQILGGASLHVGLLAVNVGGQPRAGTKVQAPTVEMEIETGLGVGGIGSVEADDVVILILDPDSAHKAADTRAFLGFGIDHQAAYFSQKLTADEGEVIVL